MMALHDFCEKLFFEEETSDHERSILLVDIMNAIGFSKSEREICIHWIHHNNVLDNIFRNTIYCALSIFGKKTYTMFSYLFIYLFIFVMIYLFIFTSNALQFKLFHNRCMQIYNIYIIM
jgi:hypothetical protein